MNAFCKIEDLANEGDVELKLVYPLLTTAAPLGLGFNAAEIWSKPDIRKYAIGKGTTSKLYHPDFVVVQSGIPILIVEAKHPDASLDDGLREARLYATEVNAKYPKDLNPCRYVVSCNGKQIVACPWDTEIPIFSLEFDQLDSVNIEFSAFLDALSKSELSIQAESLRQKITLSGELTRPIDLIGGSSTRNEEVGYNDFGAELAVNFSHLFNPQDKQQRMHIARNAYVNSRRRDHYLDEIDRVVKNALPKKRGGVKLLEDSSNPTEILHVLGRGKELQKKIMLLVGARGAGKSTFVEYFQSTKLPDAISETTLWLNVDFKVNPPSSDRMEEWVLDRIIKGFASSSQEDFDDWEVQQKVLGPKLRAFKKGPIVEIKEDATEYKRELYKFARSILDDKEAWATCLSRYLVGDTSKLLVLVFDNADKGNPEDQLHAFQVVQWVQSWLPCLVFLPMRDVTYEANKNIPPLDTIIKEFIFRIAPPQFTKVLQGRVRLALDELQKTSSKRTLEYSLENGARVTYPETDIGIYLACIYKSLFDHDELLKRMLVGLAGHDIRRAMEIFLDFCRSGHIGNKEIFSIRALKGNYSLPYGVISRVLLRVNRRFYDGDTSHIKNLFQADPDEQAPNHIVRFAILSWLRNKRKKQGPTGIQGFHQATSVISDLVAVGFSSDRVVNELRYLIGSNCVYTERQRDDEFEIDDLVIIAPAGYATFKMSSRIDYLAACSEETWMHDKTLAQCIADRIGKDGISGHYLRRTTRDNARDFSKYLVETAVKGMPDGYVVDSSIGHDVLDELKRIESSILSLVTKEEGEGGWANFASKNSAGDIIDGVIDGVSEQHGLFVKMPDGPVGLLHHSRLPDDKSTANFRQGESIKVEILSINERHEKIKLQMAAGYENEEKVS